MCLFLVYEEEITPVKPREEGDHAQRLSAVALAVLVFYKASGGPFGREPTVSWEKSFRMRCSFIC